MEQKRSCEHVLREKHKKALVHQTTRKLNLVHNANSVGEGSII